MKLHKVLDIQKILGIALLSAAILSLAPNRSHATSGASSPVPDGILVCGFPTRQSPWVNGVTDRSATRYEVDFNKDGNVYLIFWDNGNEPPTVNKLSKSTNNPDDGVTAYWDNAHPAVEILVTDSGVHLLEHQPITANDYTAECK